VRTTPARTLAAAGTAGTGAAAGAAAYLLVRGLPGLLYAAGICLAAFVGAIAFVASRTGEALDPVEVAVAAGAMRVPRWRRKARLIAELQVELATTTTELDEHRRALANLATQLSRESQAAERTAQQLEQQIRELEAQRDELLDLVARERERFEQTLDELGGGLGRHGNELEKLERELEALIAR
jgi:alkanesulfonate monooxygenase SsuD/methylene tetrahydromethanopterin reductase-like flavin-dependent oxidoreductase (luciferase family)